MKKFLVMCVSIIVLYFIWNYAYYNKGLYINSQGKTINTNTKNIGKTIYLKNKDNFEEFEIKGVDMGVGIPGHFPTEYAVKKEDYMRWFKYIEEMGANTIRVYTILHDDFYDAVYEYNINNDNPIYIIHGLWVNDYIQNSHRDAYDSDFLQVFLNDSKTLVDVIHGKKNLSLGRGIGSGIYRKDISPWVLGYILGVEWEDVTVAYTDNMNKDKNKYSGKYMYTAEEATPFEAMLAQVGDKIIEYESNKYGEQRLVAFSNWPTTDPFEYPEKITNYFQKFATVDVEHIKTTENFISGVFASYHIYPYYPDFLNYEDNLDNYVDDKGEINTYRAYLKKINDYHTIPVVISEFGVPTSRGMAQKDINTGRNQGRMSEKDQGEALVRCYNDIKAAGCAGSIIFTWQDEWFKRTWNTIHAIDLLKTPYWSDYQTNEQYFGLLSFDPGKEKSICYVDGDVSEWNDNDMITQSGDMKIYSKYDEKFIYFLVHKKDLKESDRLYIPIDTTQKSGSKYCQNYNINFNRDVDFIISIDGKYNSRVVVQERYEALRAVYYNETNGVDAYENPPDINSSIFKNINLILQTPQNISFKENNIEDLNRLAEVYETGLLTYGNSNPNSEEFNSLADFCFNGEYIELKLPWQLLNFSNPTEMNVHDDYYLNYGIENMKIDKMYMGIGEDDKSKVINLKPLELKGWGRKITYHERLKSSYYYMQKVWNTNRKD